MNKTIRVSCRKLQEVAGLEALWRDLETRASCSFFVTWPWIGAWLEHLPPHTDVRLLKAFIGTELVGIAAVVKTRRRLGTISLCDAWHLHASGDPGFDSICIEHNDFLVDARRADEIRLAMIQAWTTLSGRVAELHLPGLSASGLTPQLSAQLHRACETKMAAGVDLQAVRTANLDFISLMSSHARRFVRRSIKEYEKLGPLVIDEAATLVQAQAFLDALVDLHNDNWRRRGLPGAFAGPGVMAFHRRLVELAWPLGGVQVLRVRAGDQPVGYLYSFVRAGRLSVYQSAFDYQLIEKHGKPGLVTHTLAIQHNAAKGHGYYDLLAGESQYKDTLSTVTEPLTWEVWSKPSLRFAAERMGRQAVRRLRQMRSGELPKAEAPQAAAM
ncbi:MAG: hypothetical protein RL375_3535 [Pseudomonadota bacterium]